MNSIALSRSLRNLRTGSVVLPLLCPALCTFRAASLNSAIHQGIRRSKGVGFKGKERSRTQDVGESYGRKAGAQRYAEPSEGLGVRGKMRMVGSDGKSGVFSRREIRKPSNRDEEVASVFEKRLFGNTGAGGEASRGKGFDRGSNFGKRSDARSLGRPTTRLPRDNKGYNQENAGSGRRSWEQINDEVSQDSGNNERHFSGKENYPSLSSKASSYGSTPRSSYNKERRPFNETSSSPYRSHERSFKSEDHAKLSRQHGSQGKNFKSEERRTQLDAAQNSPDEGSSSQSRIDPRMPVSIPYTTPASEFLYGTSVVEAALSSRRVPRRKHYKLYIYKGQNREDGSVERDAGLERLAKKNGVAVVRVSGDWLRIMDKMSGGRPHNGYILEASPLPRKPITSLGEVTLTDSDSGTGFKVNLDHQSREEAAVNGTDDFIKSFSRDLTRKPLVLLLDSIVDPGNLGGIIRTASFLGVTAIAVSTRNSASFTSVVLKASAGASENVTLFSVNKPAGFLVDSKAAGWKVYAAVAPSGRQDPDVPESLTTDDLGDPLSENPCILMLGGEGEGLRWNLRSKADVDLSIRGSGRSHNVDSLNVSVAAGILCSSFLSKSNTKTSVPMKEEAKVGEDSQPAGDLF